MTLREGVPMSVRRHWILKSLLVSAIVLLFVGLGVGPEGDPGAESATSGLETSPGPQS